MVFYLGQRFDQVWGARPDELIGTWRRLDLLVRGLNYMIGRRGRESRLGSKDLSSWEAVRQGFACSLVADTHRSGSIYTR